MARETRSESSHRAAVNNLAYVLELLGSMLYIIAAVYVLNSFNGSAQHVFGTLVAIGNGFWLPLFYGVAFVGTVLLFIVSFTNLMKSRSLVAHRYGMIIAVVTGFAWIGLTFGNVYLSILVMFGFIISALGSAYGMVDLLDSQR